MEQEHNQEQSLQKMGKNDSRMNRVMEQHLNDLRAEMKALSLEVTKEISEMKQKMDEILCKFDEIVKCFSAGKVAINTPNVSLNTQGLPTVKNEIVGKEIDEMTGKFGEHGNHFFDNQGKDSSIAATTSSTSQGFPGVVNELLQQLNFPRFNGDNPKSWIRKCEDCFVLMPITDVVKVSIASFHMEGEAEIWYTNYVKDREGVDWNRFSEMVLEKFCEPREENLTGAFNKVQEHGSVEEYIARFLELKASMLQMYGTLTEEFFMQSFMGGLKEDLGYTVKMMNPHTLSQAIELAGVQESCLEAAISKEQEEIRSYYIMRKGPRGSSYRKNLPVRRLTCEEIESRRSRGLCFNCDERYFTEHKCKNLFLIMGKEKAEVTGSRGQSDDEDYQFPVHALGSGSTKGVKLLGRVENKNLLIIVGTGSTDSFLDIQTARRLGCELEYTNLSTFELAHGGTMYSYVKCNGFQWEMGGHTFSADLWVRELGDDDMILGTDFLRTLGPFGLEDRTMTLKKGGKVISLPLVPFEVAAKMKYWKKLKLTQRKN